MGAIDNVREVAKLVKDLGNIELYRQILDLQGEIMELTQANRELQTKFTKLENTLTQVGKMEFRSPFYYADGDNVPHCPRCWEVNRRPVHLTPPRSTGVGPEYDCPECKFSIYYPRSSR